MHLIITIASFQIYLLPFNGDTFSNKMLPYYFIISVLELKPEQTEKTLDSCTLHVSSIMFTLSYYFCNPHNFVCVSPIHTIMNLFLIKFPSKCPHPLPIAMLGCWIHSSLFVSWRHSYCLFYITDYCKHIKHVFNQSVEFF